MGKRPHPRQTATAWTPFRAAQQVPADILGNGTRAPGRVYENNHYTVIVSRVPDRAAANPTTSMGVYHLSIRRNDREVIRDWRDLQRIKNELVGPEHLGVELYPPESELVDTSNQYHLWVFADPELRLGFGYNTRLVAEGSYSGAASKARQRPFAPDTRPADLRTGKELEAMSEVARRMRFAGQPTDAEEG